MLLLNIVTNCSLELKYKNLLWLKALLPRGSVGPCMYLCVKEFRFCDTSMGDIKYKDNDKY